MTCDYRRQGCINCRLFKQGKRDKSVAASLFSIAIGFLDVNSQTKMFDTAILYDSSAASLLSSLCPSRLLVLSTVLLPAAVNPLCPVSFLVKLAPACLDPIWFLVAFGLQSPADAKLPSEQCATRGALKLSRQTLRSFDDVLRVYSP